MRYDKCLTAGYPIASVVVEAACRHVVKDRLERTGMTWTVGGAQAIPDLHCIHSGQAGDKFTVFCVDHQIHRRYPSRPCLSQFGWAFAS